MPILFNNTNINTSGWLLTIPIPIPIQLKNPIPIILAISGMECVYIRVCDLYTPGCLQEWFKSVFPKLMEFGKNKNLNWILPGHQIKSFVVVFTLSPHSPGKLLVRVAKRREVQFCAQFLCVSWPFPSSHSLSFLPSCKINSWANQKITEMEEKLFEFWRHFQLAGLAAWTRKIVQTAPLSGQFV